MINPELALLAWIGVAIWLFASRRPSEAALICIIGSLLVMPLRAGFNLPILPNLGGQRIGILAAFVGATLIASRQMRIRGRGRWVVLLPLLAMLSSFLTWATNRDAVSQGVRFLQGMEMSGALSLPITQAIDLLMPFLVGFCLVRTPRAVRGFYVVLIGAALLYSILVLYEVRMSPTLHATVYGYRQAGFGQTVRFSGWRPMVFTEHGLALAMFLSTSVIAAAAAMRARLRVFTLPTHVTLVFLGIVLWSCKSVAAIVYSAALVPVLFLTSPRNQVRIAALMAALVLTYPTLRSADLFPTQPILAAAASVGKSGSLEFRFRHEDALSARARERALFGWGAWNRNRIFNPKTGEDDSVTDGAWIIVFGQRGFFGFFTFFGTLLAPIVLALTRVGRLRDPRHRQLLAGLALVTAVRAVDLLPNGFFMGPLTALTAGALGGASIGLVAYERAQRAAAAAAPAASAPPAAMEAEAPRPAPPTEQPAPGLGRILRTPRPRH